MKMLAVFAAAVILQAAPAQAWTGQTAFFMEDFMAAGHRKDIGFR